MYKDNDAINASIVIAIFQRFGMPVRQMKVSRPILTILLIKFVAVATTLEQSEEEGQIFH